MIPRSVLLTPDNSLLHLPESAWRAPLVPVALAWTVGLIADRVGEVPFPFSVVLAGVALVLFALCRFGGSPRTAPAFLLLTVAALGAAHHHFHRDLHADDDVGHLLGEQRVPVRLRGILLEEPRRTLPDRSDPPDSFRTQQPTASASTVVQATALLGSREQSLSGRLAVFVTAPSNDPNQRLLVDLHPGDAIELIGYLGRPETAGNPGEFDRRTYYRNRGIRAVLSVSAGNPAVRLIERRWPYELRGWLGWLRYQAHERLQARFDDTTRPTEAGLVRALLLGDGAPLTQQEWNKYIRTGVVHVLAISGQHLAIAGLGLWFLALRLGIRQRRAILVIAGLLLGYALLTGGRPPVLRAALFVALASLAVLLHRPVMTANLLALAWIVVLWLQPADLTDPGTQFSFLAVAVLVWAGSWLSRPTDDPLRDLIDDSRPGWLLWCIERGRDIRTLYLLNLIVWLALTPLGLYHYGLLATPGLWLGPPLSLCATGALLGGFLALLLPAELPWLVALSVAFVRCCLRACEMLVDGAEVWPHHLYPGPIPLWLTASFYAVFLAWLVHPPWYRHGRHLLPLAVGWLCLVAGGGLWSRGSDALRITFVAVGHGGCVVLEMPDDRVLLYDAGSLRGPEVGARTIAPFLWSRRISRIDTVILSHADLDHFNGLVGLLERFAVGQVLCADSFVASPKPGVQRLRNELARRRVPLQTVQAGDRLTTRSVTLEVLHPPATYREGNDNARSLILYVQHGPHRVLLTGDLEGAGLERLLSQPPRRVDVLQAPHHGSESLDIEGLLRWCQPRCVLSCQGPMRSGHLAGSAYNRRGVPFYDTHRLGAITLLSQADGLWLERYHSAERLADEPLEPIPEDDDGG